MADFVSCHHSPPIFNWVIMLTGTWYSFKNVRDLELKIVIDLGLARKLSLALNNQRGSSLYVMEVFHHCQRGYNLFSIESSKSSKVGQSHPLFSLIEYGINFIGQCNNLCKTNLILYNFKCHPLSRLGAVCVKIYFYFFNFCCSCSHYIFYFWQGPRGSFSLHLFLSLRIAIETSILVQVRGNFPKR